MIAPNIIRPWHVYVEAADYDELMKLLEDGETRSGWVELMLVVEVYAFGFIAYDLLSPAEPRQRRLTKIETSLKNWNTKRNQTKFVPVPDYRVSLSTLLHAARLHRQRG